MANSRGFSNLDQQSQIFSDNLLRFNAAVGVFYSQGETKPLFDFLQQMTPYHITSFLGGTVDIQQLDSPLIVYRAGDMGEYWTTTPPHSPWQHCLEMAMHPNLYPTAIGKPSIFSAPLQ